MNTYDEYLDWRAEQLEHDKEVAEEIEINLQNVSFVSKTLFGEKLIVDKQVPITRKPYQAKNTVNYSQILQQQLTDGLSRRDAIMKASSILLLGDKTKQI